MQNAGKFAQNLGARMRQAAKEAGKASGGGGSGGAPPGGGGPLNTVVSALMVTGAVSYLGYKSVVIIQPGHMGVVYNRIGGLDEKARLQEGLNFVFPFFQRANIYDTRVRSQVVNTSSGSKDLQQVQISLRVLFRPNKDKLPTLYRFLGRDYDQRVLPSIVNEIVKAVVAKYNAAELIMLRDTVSRLVKTTLQSRAKDFEIIVDDVAISHIAFSKDYTAAIEAKQVAQQDSERAKYIVEKAEQEKLAIVIKAEGEARSAELIGNAVRENPAFIQLRRIDAAREVAKVITQSPNKVYLNSDSLMLNNLGDLKVKAEKKGWLW
jgi:prohibitin 2